MTLPPGIQRVGFIICGTQKGGTTSLYGYLRRHPEICMAMQKEVHFFDDYRIFSGDRANYAPYHECFRPMPGHRLAGEATPVYMYLQDVPRRIWQYNPDMKLIVLLRNPIERAYSHWNMRVEEGRENLDFLQALLAERERARAFLPWQDRRNAYVARGFYMEQLRRLWRFFPPEQVLVMKSEFLRNDRKACLDEICHFLGVAAMQSQPPISLHTRSYAEPMSAQAWEYLHGIFEPEVLALERTLGWDCGDWLVQPRRE